MSKPDKPIRIFISCIPQEMEKELDLLEKEVFRQLLDKFSKLEFYCSESAKLEEDFTLNLARIDECDLFIALLGERYGETAQFSDRRLQFKTSDHSQLEIEVRYALQLSKPIQIYTRDPSFIEALPASERANDIERPKMVRFQRELGESDHPVWSYGVLAELRDFVARDLAEFIEARQPSRQRPVYLDENVQFTVYRPRTVEPEKWYHLLAFAHLSERRSDAPDEPDPLQEVRRQAEALLGAALPNYRDLTEDSRFAVPREHELIFLPTIPQVVFNPARRAFLWTTESVHREEFRMKTSAKPGEMLRGNMTVFLGSIILAEINLVVRVSAEGTSRAAPLKAVSSRPYHKIFASYSHRDIHIVEEFDRYVGALGHKYLRDAVDLRSGEVWNERLLRMIDEADIFQLFWSSNSMRSPFVRHEWEYALTLNRPFFVRPTYWEEPFPELPEEGLPPEGLRRMHFTQLRFAEIPPMAKFVPASPPLEKKKASSRTGNRACYNCDGAGRVTCSGCGGRGSIWHSSPSGPQWSPCAVCGGQRQLRCPVCQGVGQLSSSNFPPVLSSPPAPLSSPPAPPTYSPLTKWWSKLPDRSKMALLVGLGIFAILVVIYFLING